MEISPAEEEERQMLGTAAEGGGEIAGGKRARGWRPDGGEFVSIEGGTG